MQTENTVLNAILDAAQREEIIEFVRNAPDTGAGVWLKQQLPERGGNGHVASHRDDVLVALVAVMAATINEQGSQIAGLREALERVEVLEAEHAKI